MLPPLGQGGVLPRIEPWAPPTASLPIARGSGLGGDARSEGHPRVSPGRARAQRFWGAGLEPGVVCCVFLRACPMLQGGKAATLGTVPRRGRSLRARGRRCCGSRLSRASGREGEEGKNLFSHALPMPRAGILSSGSLPAAAGVQRAPGLGWARLPSPRSAALVEEPRAPRRAGRAGTARGGARGWRRRRHRGERSTGEAPGPAPSPPGDISGGVRGSGRGCNRA